MSLKTTLHPVFFSYFLNIGQMTDIPNNILEVNSLSFVSIEDESKLLNF